MPSRHCEVFRSNLYQQETDCFVSRRRLPRNDDSSLTSLLRTVTLSLSKGGLEK